MIKTLLAVIVSLAMAIGGTAAMPAVPETERTFTLSDFVLSAGGETVALDVAAQLSAALGTDELDLHFQLNMPDGTLMPVSAKLTNDGVQFIISDTGKVYTLSDDTICEMLGITEEDLALDMVESYTSILKLAQDGEFQKTISEKMMNYLTSLADAEPEAVEIEADGETLPAQKWIINTDIKGIYGVYDVLAESGNADLENYMQGLLGMMNELMAGEDVTVERFADLADLLDLEIPVYMELTLTEDQRYANVLMNMSIENEMQMVMTETVSPDGVNMNMEMNTPGEGNAANMVMDMNIAGPVEAPESVLLTFGVTTHEGYTLENPAEEEGGEPSVFTNSIDVNVSGSFSWINTDGLSDIDAVLTVDDVCFASTTGAEEYSYDYSSSREGSLKYSETAEEDGSVTGHLDFDITADGEPVSFSLNINRAEKPFEDHFAGHEIVELPADTESEAYDALNPDLLCLLADVNTLTTDESVLQLVNLFAYDSVTDYVNDSVLERNTNDAADDDYEQQLADAMAAFMGTPVDYAAPEGYKLDYVYASDDNEYVSADYLNPETGEAFELMLTAYEEERTDYEYLPIGAAESVTGPVAELQMRRGAYTCAIIRLPLGDAMFTFPEDAAFDAVQSILAGFEVK